MSGSKRAGRAIRPTLERVESRALLSTVSARLATGTITPADLRIGQPTPHEQGRLRFNAALSGPYVVGPGRYTGVDRSFYLRGVGTSSAFLHGEFQMEIVRPVDPSSPLIGTATLFDRNINNGSLVLNIQGDRSAVDRFGRPTRLNWQVSDASGASFTDAAGSGTMQIRYFSGGRGRQPRVLEQGNAAVVLRGMVYATGTNNVTSAIDIGT